MPQGSMISQSAMSNYSTNVQNIMVNQHSNRGTSQPSANGGPSSVTRPSSRKKGNVQNLIYDQSLSMYYNGSGGGAASSG